MQQIPIGFPPDMREHLNAQSKINYESIATYIRRLVLEDMRKVGETTNVKRQSNT